VSIRPLRVVKRNRDVRARHMADIFGRREASSTINSVGNLFKGRNRVRRDVFEGAVDGFRTASPVDELPLCREMSVPALCVADLVVTPGHTLRRSVGSGGFEASVG